MVLAGDVMGPSIEGLERLLRMPTGCGEQNMIGFVPNIVVRSYLEDMKQLDLETKTKTTKFMEIGLSPLLRFC